MIPATRRAAKFVIRGFGSHVAHAPHARRGVALLTQQHHRVSPIGGVAATENILVDSDGDQLRAGVNHYFEAGFRILHGVPAFIRHNHLLRPAFRPQGVLPAITFTQGGVAPRQQQARPRPRAGVLVDVDIDGLQGQIDRRVPRVRHRAVETHPEDQARFIFRNHQRLQVVYLRVKHRIGRVSIRSRAVVIILGVGHLDDRR